MGNNILDESGPSKCIILGDLKSYQTARLLDLIQYDLLFLHNLGIVWHSVPHVVETIADNTDDDLQITDEHREKVKKKLERLNIHLRIVGLKQSRKYLEEVEKERLAKNVFTLAHLRNEAEILQGRINHELEDVITGFIPAHRAHYFENDELFGSEVKTSFPSAAHDIKEAGTCFAHGNWTASVFHLMRALEYPLRCLARDLKVPPPAKHPKTPLELRTWGDVIDKIITAINARPNPKNRKAAELTEFYNRAADQFQFFKDAWRDVVMHTRSKPYGEGETEDLIKSVETFMKRLSVRLKEHPKR